MSIGSIRMPPLPPPRVETEEEYAERIRNAIRRDIKAAEEGRVFTHEEAMRRLAPWLGE
jgi:predicted transcriptional regulator